MGGDGHDRYIDPWDHMWKYIIDFASWPTRFGQWAEGVRQLAESFGQLATGTRSVGGRWPTCSAWLPIPIPPGALICLAGTIIQAYRPQRT
jgi:hypothetical protein